MDDTDSRKENGNKIATDLYLRKRSPFFDDTERLDRLNDPRE